MEHNHQGRFCLECSLSEIIPLLPRQGPIKDFIHQNILQVFIDKDFDEALNLGAKIFKAKAYMDLCFYRSKWHAQEIDEKLLLASIKENQSGKAYDTDVMSHALINFIEVIDKKSLYALAKRLGYKKEFVVDQLIKVNDALLSAEKTRNIHHELARRLPKNFHHDVHAILFRLIGSFVDQGVTLWPFMERSENFQQAILRLAKSSRLPIAHFVDNQELANYLSMPIEASVKDLLAKILSSERLYHNYIKESLLNHPGWSGMVNVIEHNPQSLAKFRKISIEQMLVVKLAFEWQFIANHGKNFQPIAPHDLDVVSDEFSREALSLTYWLLRLPKTLPVPTKNHYPAFALANLQKIWHRALENTYYQNVAQIFRNTKSLRLPKSRKKFQIIFCLDDRECSFRRHLESVCPDVETLSFPGFFGVDCFFKPHKRDLLEKMCPVPVNPRHVVMEEATAHYRDPERKLLELASFISRHGANSILFGFISAYTLGHLSLFRLLLGFLHPFKLLKTEQLTIQAEKTQLLFTRQNDKKTDRGLLLGYTHEEMADRVFNVLLSMGLYENFSPLIFAVGHGSSSVNNPHFAAYECGACSGRPGAVNARLFAAMANIREVRQMIKLKGITIPDETVFIGGFHDTCNDDVRLFDLDNLSSAQKILLSEFLPFLQITRARNAQERCERFSLVKKHISAKEALQEVSHRARALFEPRPEMGHATNALCIVGRRSRTIGKNFQRRAFLQSYDPTIDQNGDILADIMNAVIPVCGGINLDYFFSRLDPAIYGCGTKLSHNVCSLIGVGNGLDDDLRTGIPIQMTEFHDPIRLLIIIEQHPTIIAKAVLHNAALSPWVKNDWVKIASLDPEKNQLTFLKAEGDFFKELAA